MGLVYQWATAKRGELFGRTRIHRRDATDLGQRLAESFETALNRVSKIVQIAIRVLIICHRLKRRGGCFGFANDSRFPGVGMNLVQLQFVMYELCHCSSHIGAAQVRGEICTCEPCSREQFYIRNEMLIC